MAKRRGGLGLLLLLAAGAGASAWGRERHRAVQQVPPDMRSPMLYAPFAIRNTAELHLARRLRIGDLPPRAGVQLRRLTIPGRTGGVPVYVYRPTKASADPTGALLWIHGGGYVAGRPDGYHDICSRFAAELGIVVVSVDYRLAPEHPFPAGLDDCLAALEWMHAQASELGIDPARLAIGGDSAGGGLTAALAQRVHDQGRIPLRLQLLVYPMLDDRSVLRPDHGDRGRLVWGPASNRFAWTAYLGHRPGEQEPPPYAVPARREDLRGLAPAWIGVGTLDLFYEEDVEYAQRLTAAGVPCELHVVPGMYHGADSMAWRTSPAARDFGDRLLGAVWRALSPD